MRSRPRSIRVLSADVQVLTDIMRRECRECQQRDLGQNHLIMSGGYLNEIRIEESVPSDDLPTNVFGQTRQNGLAWISGAITLSLNA
jgi:hypothetical protein